jgi:hypothetical protein
MHIGDTTLYVFRDSLGRALVAGRMVHYGVEHISHAVRTDTARLRLTIDSLRVGLDQRYGDHTICLPEHPEDGWRCRGFRWVVGDSATVLLMLHDLEHTAWIWVEAHARAVSCESEAGPASSS